MSVYLGCGVWSSTAILVLVLLQCKQNLWAIVGACPSVFSACCFALFNLQPSNVIFCRPGRPWFKSKEADLVESVRMPEIPGMFKSGLLQILKVASLKWPINTMFTWFAVTRKTGLLLFRYNSEILQRRINNIFLPLSGGNNEKSELEEKFWVYMMLIYAAIFS